MQRIVFYVSGHGYGHARRSAATIAALVERCADVAVTVRTSAPARIFAGMDRVNVEPPEMPLDFGAAEVDATTIDVPGTLAGAKALLERQKEIVAHEVRYLRQRDVRMVLADIPFLVGEVVRAYRADARWQVPAIAIGNFTWDWIYEPYFAGDPQFASAGETMRAAYRQFDLCLRLPFAHAMPFFPQVQDVPLVARPPQLSVDQVLPRLGLAGHDSRPRVLLAMRGGMSQEMVSAAARGAPDFLFLSLQNVPAGAPANLRPIAIPAEIDFTDVLRACAVTVSKLGYGLVADAIICQTALLWPPRTNFREDELFRPTLGHYTRAYEIPLADFRAGRWAPHLAALMALPAAAKVMRTDGAAVCAEAIAGRLTAPNL